MKRIIFILIVCLLLTGCNSWYWKEKDTNECVKEKWIKYKNDDAKYLIGAKSGEVYQIADSWLKWRFDSSDLYNEIEKDKCYVFTYFGWRIGFFSTYKNIYQIKGIDQEGN